MNVLILGGTVFLGIHLTEVLQNHGHQVTLFNRGTKNPLFFHDVEKLIGDRNDNLQALLGRRFDAVIDTSGYIPRIVELSAKVLSNVTDHYTFISTINVYENFQKTEIDETFPLAQLADPQNETFSDQSYGPLKALCEDVIQRYFPMKSLIIRPGIIVGPNDPTGRFTYWLRRLAAGGEVLAPPNQPLQVIDVSDLAKWTIEMIERRSTGIYNATGESISFNYLLQECQKISPQSTHQTWVSENFLHQKNVQGWTDLPLWLTSESQRDGLFTINSQKAIKEGLKYRPLSETILRTLQWDLTRDSHKTQTGLNRSKEKELLKEWEKEKSFLESSKNS